MSDVDLLGTNLKLLECDLLSYIFKYSEKLQISYRFLNSFSKLVCFLIILDAKNHSVV